MFSSSLSRVASRRARGFLPVALGGRVVLVVGALLGRVFPLAVTLPFALVIAFAVTGEDEAYGKVSAYVAGRGPTRHERLTNWAALMCVGGCGAARTD